MNKNEWLQLGLQTCNNVLVVEQRCLDTLYAMGDTPIKSADVSSSSFPDGGEDLSEDHPYVYPKSKIPACLFDSASETETVDLSQATHKNLQAEIARLRSDLKGSERHRRDLSKFMTCPRSILIHVDILSILSDVLFHLI